MRKRGSLHALRVRRRDLRRWSEALQRQRGPDVQRVTQRLGRHHDLRGRLLGQRLRKCNRAVRRKWSHLRNLERRKCLVLGLE